jgi:two-component system repressor protein LuxO
MTGSGLPIVLLVEDSPSLSRAYEEYLRNGPYKVVHVDTGAAAIAELDRRVPEAVVLDLKLPDMDGMSILTRITGARMPTVVIVITAHGSINVAVDAMRGGAFDFLVKPFTAERLIFTLRNALERQRLERMVKTYQEDIARTNYCGFIGASLPMQAIYRIIDSAAPSRATVFITGESGTGKELGAEAIHRQSPRGIQPFVAINCGAIPRGLMESEIFGHVRGAFTGATNDRDGAASRAHGGTLFLDEICELDLDLQAKLLRFVQTGSFERVGGSRTEKVDVRIVCATNQDPLKAVEEGRFREDLYYRLHVIPIVMPPLREREGDAVLIAREFLNLFAREESKRFVRFEPEIEAVLQGYEWPGNVRQLQNVIRNIVVLHDGETVTASMLPPLLAVGTRGPAVVSAAAATVAPLPSTLTEIAAIKPLWMIEKEAIEQAIDLCDGNVPRAAVLLGVSPSTLYRKRQAWTEAARGAAATLAEVTRH